MESKNKHGEVDDNMLPISQEEENHARLYLLLSGISERAIRALFDREFDPSRLPATLLGKYCKLKDLKKDRIINQSQWKLLHPTNSK